MSTTLQRLLRFFKLILSKFKFKILWVWSYIRALISSTRFRQADLEAQQKTITSSSGMPLKSNSKRHSTHLSNAEVKVRQEAVLVEANQSAPILDGEQIAQSPTQEIIDPISLIQTVAQGPLKDEPSKLRLKTTTPTKISRYDRNICL